MSSYHGIIDPLGAAQRDVLAALHELGGTATIPALVDITGRHYSAVWSACHSLTGGGMVQQIAGRYRHRWCLHDLGVDIAALIHRRDWSRVAGVA